MRWLCLFLSLELLWGFASANDSDVIYGTDDRVDIHRSDLKYQRWAKSTVAMIEKKYFELKAGSDHYEISKNNTQKKLCEGENFNELPLISNCSGFLVGKNILVTAGHCVSDLDDCKSSYWVFNYTSKIEKNGELSIHRDDVYTCKRVMHSVQNRDSGADWAIIELDGKHHNRPILPIRKKGRVSSRTSLAIIGHPSGLPKILTKNVTVRENTNPVFFVVEADTFEGNSGSPVLNDRSGIVEGILVRGESDYDFDTELGCLRARVCKTGECRGEDVLRANVIPWEDFL